MDLARLGTLLGALPRLSVVAFHGDSESLVRGTTRSVLRTETRGDHAALRVSTVQTSDARVIEGALSSGALGGGRPVVWVAEASEKWGALVGDVLRLGPGCLLLLGFGPRFDKTAMARAIASDAAGCVVDCTLGVAGANAALLAVFEPLRVTADAKVLRSLAAWAQASGQSLESIGNAAALLVGEGGRIDASALAWLGATSEGGAVGAGVRAGLGGDRETLDRAVGQALRDDQTGVGLVRQALGQVQFARTLDQRQRTSTAGAAGLDAAARGLWIAERGSKRTGAPQDLLAAAAVRALTPRG